MSVFKQHLLILGTLAGAATYACRLALYQLWWIACGPWTGWGVASAMPSWPALLPLVVAEPVIEEYLFRKWLAGYFLKRFGFLPAWLASTMLFVLAHYQYWCQPANLAAVAVLGLACGYAYLRSGSLVPAILIHGVNNLLVEVPKDALYDGLARHAHGVAGHVAWDAGILVVSTSLLCVLLRRFRRGGEAAAAATSDDRSRDARRAGHVE